ncbi:MAG: tRNA (adenosine(37)-N6)-threonylcarbamoyltransferase complex transferase subunit TsaD [Ruminococcaceae bacterium]|nr:tRNA (adenosine(37)-N6)-threonylcarbamoyltransferase complex transferase subunit TsaD [Oscillospiraceae bacterium]
MAYILGIETSCDETAASVTENGRKVLSNVVYSQIPLHTIYGGVVPEIASRKHIDKIIYVIDQALKDANITKDQLDAVAVTYNPGLVGALLVGVSVAKAFAYSIKKPLVPVNHIQGHIAANYIAYPELEPPFVSLVASGGHSHILHIKDYRSFDVIGATTDDAAGEAFDKAARVLGLGYPGGPKLNALAKEGNPEAIRFPRPHNGYDFSFSGLKTAVINYVHTAEQKGEEINKADVAASFQQAVCDVLVNNTVAAAKELKVDKIAIAGGVAANTLLREQMESEGKKNGLKFYCPPIDLCTDNAAMISCAGYLNFEAGIRGDLDLNAIPQLSISDVL